jgi:hypothetical protein
MKNDTKVVMILALIAVVFMCSVMYSGIAPERTTGTIDMVQPKGWLWTKGYDAHYAGNVNLPNSQANENNSQARLNDAHAEKVKAEAAQPYMLLHGLGLFASIIGFVIVMIVVAGAFIFAASRRE